MIAVRIALIAFLAVTSTVQAAANAWTVERHTVAELLDNPKLVSTAGRDFNVITLTKGHGNGPRYYVQGALHGNEQMTAKMVFWLAQRLSQNQGPLAQLPNGTQIDFLPYANPDMYGASRYNGNGINLNRNFGILWGVSSEPFGNKPESENETKAIVKLMALRKYTAAVDIHGYVNWIVGPSSPEYVANATAQKSALHRVWSANLRASSALLPGYEVKDAGLLGDGGAFEDWAFWGNNTLAFCLEMHPSYATGDRHDFSQYERFIAQMFQTAGNMDALMLADKMASKAPRISQRPQPKAIQQQRAPSF